MKLNWGTSIVLSFVAFIAFILFFVVKMSTDNKANHDLVTEEYYKQELAFQKEIDDANNAKNMAVKFNKTNKGIIVEFPEDIQKDKIKGTISLYRPSNKHLDFDLPISLSKTHLLIPDKRLLDGRWDIKINFTYLDKDYLYKHNINY